MIKKLYKSLLSEKSRIDLRVFIQKIVSPIYAGNKMSCNCCGKSFRKFLPKGNIQRENAKCPYCGSLERTRVLSFYLQHKTDIFKKPTKLLHFAPEAALKRQFVKHKLIDYVDGDINPAYASQVIDVTAIPFPDNSFDYIICSHVLGHVPDELQAIKELQRVLKPTGEAIVMTVLDLNAASTKEENDMTTPEEKLKAYGEADLCRLHGMDFSDRLSKGGFDVHQVDYRKSLPDEVQAKYSLGNGEREIIFSCTKN